MDDISGEIEIELYFLNSRTPVIPGSLAVIWDVKPNTSLLLAVYGVILISLLFLECFPFISVFCCCWKSYTIQSFLEIVEYPQLLSFHGCDEMQLHSIGVKTSEGSCCPLFIAAERASVDFTHIDAYLRQTHVVTLELFPPSSQDSCFLTRDFYL